MKPDIVFFQQYGVPYFGILSICNFIEAKGYKAEVIIDSLEEDPINALKKLEPRIIGISVLSPEHQWLKEKVSAIRSAFPNTIILVGGIHAMFYSEEILSETQADIVCNSEGENVLIELFQELEKESPDFSGISGITYRDNNGGIAINEKAMLTDFNEKILEKRDIYYSRYPKLSHDTVHRFFSSRGCPYKCSFCYNSNIQEMFAGKGKYVRQKSVDGFIEEIKHEVSKYPITSIFFYDDLFSYRKKWLRPFLERYKKEIGIPFMCTTRANIIDEETAQILADAGCRTASFGIETGSYEIRKNVLKKDITDEQIIRCGHLLKKYGIKTQSTNMFCLPDETLEDAFKTIELNIKAKTDYAFCALFMPFPKQEITQYCLKKGYIRSDYSLKDLPASFLTESVLDISEKDIIRNVHRLAYFFIQYPLIFKVFKGLMAYTIFNPIYKLIFLLSNLLRHKEERGISLWYAIKYAWRLRRSF